MAQFFRKLGKKVANVLGNFLIKAQEPVDLSKDAAEE
jgi:hypothetical protein